jgi:hypothetical protein
MHRKYATKRGYDLSFDSETRFFYLLSLSPRDKGSLWKIGVRTGVFATASGIVRRAKLVWIEHMDSSNYEGPYVEVYRVQLLFGRSGGGFSGHRSKPNP